MKALKLLLFVVMAISISCKERRQEPIIEKNKATASVKHYVCAKKCENSGGDAAGNCPVCKNPYTHNVAFHNQDFMKNGPIKVPNNMGAPAANAPAQPSPAQNAMGVYHYTCAKGCYGGSGTASNCANCGAQLAHNQAYHN